ncbi:hypothetical protein Vadar_008585 [Vaccinium darrowii]|uniref:Uncharacterized protein n=1 Tax=Vaccinium darrowii TaxID=229202 RepID=A0ACB7XXM4_9ERIC|nr:hypothetical protein Vadar_008585 [Vaccinium darrowii]
MIDREEAGLACLEKTDQLLRGEEIDRDDRQKWVTMATGDPFVRVFFESHEPRLHAEGGLFYLHTASGKSDLAGVSAHQNSESLTYEAYPAFVSKYLGKYTMGPVTVWDNKDAFSKWFDSLIYYSFLMSNDQASTFIFNPTIPEAAALQAWCKANATAIKELPVGTAPRYQACKQTPPPNDKLVKIANIPASVTKPIYIGVKGTVQLVEFNQRFIYVACLVCNRGMNAFGDGEFWCNYCEKNVQPLTRVKFDVEIKDPTGHISAAMFAEEAEEFYKITSRR